MSHEHHDHAHHHHAASRKRMLIALLLTAGYAVVEAFGGLYTGSLALLSDAGHMLTDAAALGLALFAQYVARRPVSASNSYGYARAEVLGALINSLFMLAMVGWIAFEALGRLFNPKDVDGVGVMGIASIGLVVNLIAAWLLSSDSHNMNSRAALMHVLGDLLGSVAAILAGLVIWATGYKPIDPILSLLVVLLILRSTWALVLQSSHMLMEGVPAHLDMQAIGQTLAEQKGVQSIHDLHVWHLGPTRVALSAHMVIESPESWPRLLAAIQGLLAKDYGIDHVTLQPSWLGMPPRGKVIPLAALTGGDSEHDGHGHAEPVKSHQEGHGHHKHDHGHTH
ncbi:cation diffusion facilitator family transporter [Chitinimonas sp. BJB300]|uniref:cation diffusion facilitator family transporter n=1 Tax=Chitinimonas sp. BJB300 TaxID=1559339 RepID=UPI000C0F3AC0|nr:cation diffusion facilitator family transporter [Chitinimonas sp. BJB300]PHV12689.1 cation transporter [Chitinimonas sp. BJB300]TSJ91267.1 cation transporter [Chitinimonas sp. BJB300]